MQRESCRSTTRASLRPMTRRQHLAAVAGSLAAVAVVTAAIELFKTLRPRASASASSTSSPCSSSRSLWGMRYAVAGRRREHARVQLVPPAAPAHVHARGRIELVRARRVRRRRRSRSACSPTASVGGRPRPSSVSARRPCSPTSPAICSAVGTCERELESISARAAEVLGVSRAQNRARPARAARG